MTIRARAGARVKEKSALRLAYMPVHLLKPGDRQVLPGVLWGIRGCQLSRYLCGSLTCDH